VFQKVKDMNKNNNGCLSKIKGRHLCVIISQNYLHGVP
jgi:hypothetical protein